MPVDRDPLWYQHAIFYQLHVRAFQDSDGDGIGDFQGLTSRLDYLQDLGVTALWLLPFYPSPLRDDGYDIADYTDVNARYGNLADFKAFVAAAHDRGLRVVTELVLNHTSDQHEWFQKSRRARKGSKWRDFYVWSDTTDRYKDARIIFKDFEPSNWTWDEVAGQYYWHRFFHHQPDLNFDNPRVHEALIEIMDRWFRTGVDGMRLDAVPYLYEREGTSCENLQETHQFLKKLRKHLDEAFPGRMLLAEANQWPEDAAAYFGDGDECHMNFHFPVMPRLFMSLQLENRTPLVDILQQTPEIPPGCQWATFLRNHDELTLEMVTDEERDYMWRMYAHEMRARINLGIRRRLAPLLGNDRRKIELLNALLFSLPGTPIVYYGDEIGMGDNIYLGDRDGCRTPMQWSADRNAGFSRCNPQQLYLPVNIDPEYRFEAVNVEAQLANPASLLWWMRRLIRARRQHPVLGAGKLRFLHPDNGKVLAFLRESGDERVLVVANLSRFAQAAEIEVPDAVGCVPKELFGGTPFPRVGAKAYPLTLGPYQFYWLSLRAEAAASITTDTLPRLTLPDPDWTQLVDARVAELLPVLPGAVAERRWYAAKARTVAQVERIDSIPVWFGDDDARILLAEFTYTEGEPDTWVIPLAFAEGEHAEQIEKRTPWAVIARVDGARTGILYDATANEAFCLKLLESIGRRIHLQGQRGELVGTRAKAYRRIRGTKPVPTASPSKADQSNTTVVYGDQLMLKLYRRSAPGENPELEMGRYLTEEAGFTSTAAVAGWLEYRGPNGEKRTIGLLSEYVENQGDAWSHTLHGLGRFYDEVLSRPDALRAPASALAARDDADGELESQLLGSAMEDARLLGQRTAEMHLALGGDADGPAFAPEPFTPHYQRSLYQSIRNRHQEATAMLRSRVATLEPAARELAERVLASDEAFLAHIGPVKDARIEAVRIRCHGDHHLGQVLWTGRDYVIIDFEGEPARPLSERRIKRTPLRDVAGMLRSYHYAAWNALFDEASRVGIAPGQDEWDKLVAGARYWYAHVGGAFVRGWYETMGEAPIVPRGEGTARLLLDAYLLDKACYELVYELNHRPKMVRIALQGMLDVLGRTP